MGRSTRSALRALLLTSVLATTCSGIVVEKRQSAVTGWTYYGCQTEATNARALASKATAYDTMTLESCASDCAGYTYFGTEYGRECYCGNSFSAGSTVAPKSDCSSTCGGNSKEICGAGNRLSVYKKGAGSGTSTTTGKGATTTPVTPPTQPAGPGPQKTGLPSGWVYSGCLQDNIPSKEDPNQRISVFPYKVTDDNMNTAPRCIKACQQYGFNAAGLEYGSQCYCGDIQNIKVASAPGTSTNPADTQFYTYATPPQKVDDSQCNAQCSGATNYYCGSGNLLSYYSWTAPTTKWAFPTGNNAGKYSLLIGGVTVPLITAQMITGKVTFVEKAGTGNPNGTGAYELDLSQISNFGNAWRQMTPMKTDVFCSAGLILPDKAGRQLTVGGWNGQSLSGVRLYWPDGSAGKKGTNQWTEDPNNLQLLVPRWYPSAMIMANGSILVVGGEIGNNEAEQPNLEILPKTGGGTVNLPFLSDTAPFNLYPYIMVVPTGIFILYYNEARILNEKTFATIKTLPNVPGAPSRRVMPAMAGLPDGTYLICNGGQHGVAGFGLGGSPNLNAVIYDPTKPVNQRMSVMANTTVARLYHSEAIVLLDGRVMISGSDPTGNYDPTATGSFPEEYRVEVFSPPYLLSGAARPTFTITNKDWTYASAITFTSSVTGVKVSLLGSVSSTHGNSMGQRTLFPAVSCSGTSCTVTAPPNAHVCPPGWYMMFVLNGPTPSVGQYVRIGGDPAKLGNWPKISGFALPGV
ncbi:WSC domain-containing [Hyphodiscus hymeniophilus]|uniref:WSC domain-containing n=1 Tax=Hyphodiscus hymeniophilus TaxID=353542 RepID=A0A9P6SJU1_9HELO|nr:WSC domain-containing [Hyphodiscus hymeniophilus]